MANLVFTVGYEKWGPTGIIGNNDPLDPAHAGTGIQNFISALQVRGITRVLDVRANARSRNPHFNPARLTLLLKTCGIERVHLPELGVPASERHLPDRAAVFVAYRERVVRTEAFASMGPYLDGQSVLMCVERWPDECHRGVLARLLNQHYGCAVQHIVDDTITHDLYVQSTR